MGFSANRLAVADMRIRQNNVPPRWRSRSISQISPQPVSVPARINSRQTAYGADSDCRFRHGGDKFLPGILLNAHAHFLLSGICSYHACCSCAHQSPRSECHPEWRQVLSSKNGESAWGWRGDLPLIDKPQLGEKLHRSSRALQVTRLTPS